jgi:hypothetical protein
MDSNGRKYVVATFLGRQLVSALVSFVDHSSSTDIPANNCVILQKGDELEQLPAGQHYITNPSVSRIWFPPLAAELTFPPFLLADHRPWVVLKGREPAGDENE